MNTNQSVNIVRREPDGSIRWAVVWVENVSYDVYYPSPMQPDMHWNVKTTSASSFASAARFVERCRSGAEPSVSFVRPCVVKKFIREREPNG